MLDRPRRQAVVSRSAVPLRRQVVAPRARRQNGRRGRLLFRDAQDRASARTRPAPAALPQRRAAVPVRPARPGLVARRPVHRADRRGAALRHRDDQGAGLQHDAQARQGRTAPLVLLVRQARHARLAGHAERRPTSSPGPGHPRGREESAKQYETEFAAVIKALAQPPVRSSCGCRSTKAGASSTRPGSSEWVRSTRPDAPRRQPRAAGRTAASATSIDIHPIPGPAAPPNQPDRAAVLGEFGGLGLPVEGHTWQEEKNWGYRSFTTREELTEAYLDLIEKLKPLIDRRRSAAVYTQTTDVEVEVNGLMTYDRTAIKMDKDKVSRANRSVYPAMGAGVQAPATGEDR